MKIYHEETKELIFEGADLIKADLRGGIDFFEDCSQIDLFKVNFEGADLIKADLRGADFFEDYSKNLTKRY